MLKHLLFFIIIGYSHLYYGQYADGNINQEINSTFERKLLAENSRLMYEGFLYDAEKIADKLLTYQPESPNYNYRKGYLLMEIYRDYTNAIPFLKKAVTNTIPHFDAFNTKEKSAPADAIFYLAQCYHYNYELDSAIYQYRSFIDHSYNKSELIPVAELKIIQCEEAKIQIKNPVKVELINIGEDVNSKYADYSPAVSLDGSALYFTSRRPWDNGQSESFKSPTINQYPEDVYVSYINVDSTWGDSYRLDFCLPERNEATISISSDERRIYLYEDSTGSGDIYYSDFYAQKFNDIKLFPLKGVNSEYWETHCVMNSSNSRFYFSSDRPGGFGGRDLYMCTKTDNKTWSEPLNLGSTINSENDEDSPFLAVDNTTLYFSSNGKKSIGGFDIFKTTLNSDDTWTTPSNLGYPLNSTNDDIYYTTTIDGRRGYFTSFRLNGHGEKDIYEVRNEFLGIKNIAVLKGLIRTIDKSPLPEDFEVSMNLVCKNCEDEEIITKLYPRLRDGKFMSGLIPCKTYELSYLNLADSINMYTTEFTTACSDAYQEIYREVILDVPGKRIIPVKNYTIDGLVAEIKTFKNLQNVKIEVTDLNTNKIIETTTSDVNGFFTLSITKGLNYGDVLNYQLKLSKEDYYTQNLVLKETLGDSEAIHLKYFLDKPIIGGDIASSFDILPIYFNFDQSNIRPDAKIELDKIVKIMNDNPNLEIEFGSHTDCRGSYAYNMALSTRRAKSSADYIKTRITNPKRIYGKGYGESKLVNGCECEGAVKSTCSEEEHQANRRTEFRIVKK